MLKVLSNTGEQRSYGDLVSAEEIVYRGGVKSAKSL